MKSPKKPRRAAPCPLQEQFDEQLVLLLRILRVVEVLVQRVEDLEKRGAEKVDIVFPEDANETPGSGAW